MDWTALLAMDDGVRLQNGVTDEDLQDAEADLGCHLPRKLASLYCLTNGVWDEPGQWFVIWPLTDVVTRDREASQVESLRTTAVDRLRGRRHRKPVHRAPARR